MAENPNPPEDNNANPKIVRNMRMFFNLKKRAKEAQWEEGGTQWEEGGDLWKKAQQADLNEFEWGQLLSLVLTNPGGDYFISLYHRLKGSNREDANILADIETGKRKTTRTEYITLICRQRDFTDEETKRFVELDSKLTQKIGTIELMSHARDRIQEREMGQADQLPEEIALAAFDEAEKSEYLQLLTQYNERDWDARI